MFTCDLQRASILEVEDNAWNHVSWMFNAIDEQEMSRTVWQFLSVLIRDVGRVKIG